MPASYDCHWSIFKVWKDLKTACLGFADFDICSEYELKRRAIYLGIPVAQLRWVSSYGPDPISLLERRMEALPVNPVEVIAPLKVRELQHRCVMCAKRERCALDLADKFADPDWRYWRDYCPNAAALTRSEKQGCVAERTRHATENMTIRLRGNFDAMRKAKKWDAEAETGTLDKPASTSGREPPRISYGSVLKRKK